MVIGVYKIGRGCSKEGGSFIFIFTLSDVIFLSFSLSPCLWVCWCQSINNSCLSLEVLSQIFNFCKWIIFENKGIAYAIRKVNFWYQWVVRTYFEGIAGGDYIYSYLFIRILVLVYTVCTVLCVFLCESLYVIAVLSARRTHITCVKPWVNLKPCCSAASWNARASG